MSRECFVTTSCFSFAGRIVICLLKSGVIGFAVCLHCKMSHDISIFSARFGFWVILLLIQSNYLTCLLDHFLILDYFYMQAVPPMGIAINRITWFLLAVKGIKSKIP